MIKKTKVNLKTFGERLFQISNICIVKVYFSNFNNLYYSTKFWMN
jgi:hypothetical protein